MYSHRKIIVGNVVSDKNDKFRVVEEKARVVGHPLYRKLVEKTRKFHVSDPEWISKVGDLVKIQECRPISKTIRWKILEVVSSEREKGEWCDLIRQYSRLKVADNSGAKVVSVIGILGSSNRKYGYVGAKVVVTVKQASPASAINQGSVERGVIVRTSFPIKRADGSTVRFGDNAVVIIDDEGNPKGTRIFGPVSRELREKGYMKIISLAPEVV